MYIVRCAQSRATWLCPFLRRDKLENWKALARATACRGNERDIGGLRGENYLPVGRRVRTCALLGTLSHSF